MPSLEAVPIGPIFSPFATVVFKELWEMTTVEPKFDFSQMKLQNSWSNVIQSDK